MLPWVSDSNNEKLVAKQPAPKTGNGQIVFRLAENHSMEYPATIGDREFANIVEERSSGRIKIIVYYGAKLGVTAIHLSNEEKAKFEKVVVPLYDIYGKEYKGLLDSHKMY